MIVFAAGCNREPDLRLHFLPGFVAGTEHVLPPIVVAVLPATGSLAEGRSKVGAIYNDDGSVARDLYVKDPARVVSNGVYQALLDAGLKPIAVTAGKDLPPEAPLLLATRIESISINKRFSPERTVHGQYFSMLAEVYLGFSLSSREKPDLYRTVTIGTEKEPPKPVGGEVFLPLETEPAEALSVAISRAIGALILQPQFRAALLHR